MIGDLRDLLGILLVRLGIRIMGVEGRKYFMAETLERAALRAYDDNFPQYEAVMDLARDVRVARDV